MSKQQTEQTKNLELELQLANLSRKIDDIKMIFPALEEIAKESTEIREKVTNQITSYALSVRSLKLDTDELGNFFKYPYVIYQAKGDKEHTRHLAIPKFIDVSFGWLEKVTESHNIFVVNPYVDWLGDIPDALKKELDIPDPLDVSFDGEFLFGKDVKKIKEEFSSFITGETKDGKLKINKEKHFELLVGLIKKGIRPFVTKPIPKDDLTQRQCNFELRDYQKDAFTKFLAYSNIGVFFPPSTGKTWFGMHVTTHVKPPHLIVVPQITLVEQWIERIEENTDMTVGTWKTKADQEKNYEVVVMTYQSAINKAHLIHWKTLIIDEVHHLPANEFSKLSTIKHDYTIGLSATPQREDEREEYIFALTGEPVGLSWEYFKKLNIIQNPPMHVWILKNEKERQRRLEALMQNKIKTLIFCDSIDMGKTTSKTFDIPHIYGQTKDRMKKLKDSGACVVSRVGDEGVSLPDIQRVIEINWLHGSRRQELQRFTRLLHGKGSIGEGHILMTVQEYQKDHKRLFGIMDKGFKIILHREGISDKIIINKEKSIKKFSKPIVNKQSKPNTTPPNDFELNHPILSLPGIQKKLQKLSKAERLCVRVFYQEPSKQFTKEDVWNKVGIGRASDFANFTKLQELKLIKKVSSRLYQAL